MSVEKVSTGISVLSYLRAGAAAGAFAAVMSVSAPTAAIAVNTHVIRETSVVQRGSGGFRLELATAAVFQVAATTNVPVTVTLWLRYNASYNTSSGYPVVSLEGSGVSHFSTATANALDAWEMLTVSGTPTGQGVIILTIKSFSPDAGSKVYFDEIVAISTEAYTGGGDFFTASTDEADEEPIKTLYNALQEPRLYTGSGDYFIFESSYPASAILQKFYESPLVSTGVYASTLSSTAVQWNWSDNSSGKKQEEEFRVYSSTGWLRTTVAANTTYWNETGLIPNTTYWRQFRSWNVVGSSDTGAIAGVTLAQTRPVDSLTALSGSSIRVNFAGGDNPSGTLYSVKAVVGGATYYVSSANSQLTGSPDYQTLAAWGLPRDVAGLSGNTLYTFNIVARNHAGVLTEGATNAKSTLANKPVAQSFNDNFITTHSVRCYWDANGNGAGTTYRVQMSTANDFSVINGTKTTDAGIYLDFDGLSANSGYYFRVCALNLESEPTAFENLTSVGPKYTRIENPVLTASQLSMFVSSAAVNFGSQTFSKLSDGSSGIQFEESGSEGGPWTSAWEKNKIWTRRSDNPASAPALLANTTYAFRARAQNIAALGNDYTDTVVAATKIEPVLSLEWIVGSSSVGVRALPSGGGSFSNISSGLSAINYTISVNTYQWTNTGVSSSAWVKSGDYFYFTKYTGANDAITSNTTYYFISNSRNYDGVVNSTITHVAKVTLPVVPSAPVTGLSEVLPLNRIGVQIPAESPENPVDTQYAVAVATAPSGGGTYWVQTDRSTGTPESWMTKNDWNGLLWGAGADKGIKDLLWNTSYYIRVKARNSAGEATPLGETSIKVTYAQMPYDISLSTASGVSGRLDALWTSPDANAQYRVQITSAGDASGNFDYIYGDSGWVGLSSHTFTALGVNKKYFIRAISRNRGGVSRSTSTSANWTTEGDKYAYTLPDVPVGVNIKYDIGYTSATIAWSNGNNPPGTATKYSVEISSSASFQWITDSEANFSEDIPEKKFIGLSKNTVYTARVRAKNYDGGNPSAWVTTGSSCTLIETPISVIASNIAQTNATLTINWENSFNLSDAGGDGSRWQLYKEGDSNTYPSITYPEGTQDAYWRDGHTWSVQDIFGAGNGTLSANTTNLVQVKVRNKDKVETPWITSSVICSKIQNPTGIALIEATTWYVRAKPAGTFSNLGAGTTASAVAVWKTGEAEPNDEAAAGALWKTNADDYRQFDANPNAEIILYAKARNKFALPSYWGTASAPTAATYYTLAEIPPAPTLSGTTTGSMRVNILTAGNPGVTLYAVKITTSGGADRWLNSAGNITASPLWQTETQWEGDDGYKTAQGLTPNTSYFISVAARNQAGTVTNYGAVSAKWTLIEAVSSVTAIEIGSSTVKIQAYPTGAAVYTNLGSGSSHLRMAANVGAFPEAPYETVVATNVFEFTALAANAEHNFYAKSYNGEDVGSGAAGGVSFSTATRIQPASGVEFGGVTNASIEARAAGDFSNITASTSGLIVYKTSPAPAEDSGWQRNTNFWQFSGLQPNTTYYFRANSRNIYGLPNAQTAIISTVTRANAPSAPTVSIVSTDSLNVLINENSNPPATEFRILISSTNWTITKYIQANGSVGDAAVWRTKANWGGDSGRDITGLTPNTQYKLRVTARNSLGALTADSSEATRYTKIQMPDGFYYEIWRTSVSVTATGDLTNVESLGWIQFGRTANGLSWTDTSDLNGTGVQTYAWTDLAANTTYQFRIRTKNAMLDAVNDYVVDGATSTRIESVAACLATVNSSSQLSIVPSNAGAMSNLSVGQSGWRIRIQDGGTEEISYSEWRADDVAVSSSGLKPNAPYNLSGQSRNRLGLLNPWSAWYSTYTYANVPSSPVVQAVSGFDDRLKIIIDNFAANSNPSSTIYRIEIRRVIDGSWDVNTKYIRDIGGNYYITDNISEAAYKNRADWGAESGALIRSLESNVEYALRLVARNAYGHLTAAGDETKKKTLPGKPANVVAAPATNFETSRIALSWDSNAFQYRVQHATSAFGDWNDVFAAWSLASPATIHYSVAPSSQVFYRVKGRNTDLSETDWSDVVSTYTWAAKPGLSYLMQPSTYSLKIEWNTSGNPANAQYFAEVSIDSTTFSGASASGWISSTSTVIESLAQNNKYYSRVKARNPAGVSTAYGDVSAYKYTLIADCTDVVMISNSVNSIQVKGVPEPVNLGVDYNSTGIDFKNLTTGTSSQWIQTNSWTNNTGLGANWIYTYQVRVRNGDGTPEGGWMPAGSRSIATAMESPSGVTILSVSSHSVSAQVSPTGIYTQPTVDLSGLAIECHANAAYTSFVSSSGWRQEQNTQGLFSSLSANTTYYFRAKSRNKLGAESAWSGFGSTVTLCAQPTAANPADISSGSFTANWGDGGNPGGTRYELWYSTRSDYALTFTTITTDNSHNAAGSSGLLANSTYFSRIRALNRAATPTEWVNLSDILTKIEPASGIEFVDITTGSIRAKASGTFTYITDGASGWLIENITAGTSSQWQNSAPGFWLSAADANGDSPNFLKASKQYTFRARTRNRVGEVTAYVDVSTWTKARAPGYDALSQIATGTIRANWTGNENINAQYYVECSTNNDYSVAFATRDWGTAINYLFTGLAPNKRHYFRAKARNTSIAGSDTDWTYLPSSYTLVETVAAAAFPSVGVTSITVQAANAVSNITDGASGIVFKWSTDDFVSNVTSTSFIQQLSTSVAQLSANTTYYFRFVARNGDAVQRDETNSWSKSTLANAPGGAAITNPTGDSLTVGIAQNSNSAHTLYAIKAVSGNTTYYVTSAKQLSANASEEWWDTASGWSSPFALTNLAGNTPYTISARAKNSEGIVTAYSVSVTSSTLAAIPGKPTPTSLSTSTINLVVNEGTNSPATEFAILVSTDDFASNLYVQTGGTRAANAVWRAKTQWGGSSGINIADFAPNTKYAFKTQARNGDGVTTDLSIADETYTRIETPTGLAFVVHQTSMDAVAAGTFTDLGSGGIQFSFSDNNSSWADDAWKNQNQYSKTGLAPNTTYYFRVRTKNGANVINSWVYTGGIKAARIEQVATASLSFDIGASSIGVRAGQTFTNLSAGQSGLWYACYSATSPAKVTVSSSAWLSNTSFWYATGLSTNTRYFFEANSRNFDGLANSTTSVTAKYTAAVAASAPTLSNLAAPDGIIKINIVVNEGSNPDGTQYSVRVTTNEATGLQKWVNYSDPDYVLGDTAEWRTKTNWSGAPGFVLSALAPNTTHYVKIKSRNGDLVENGFSPTSLLATRANTPALTGASVVALSSSAIQINWTGDASAYWVEASSSEAGVWNNLNSGGWLVSVSTEEAGLSPNQRRFYRVKARSHGGLETGWSAAIDRYTFVITPSAAATPFDQISQTAVRAQWSANGNHPGTNYQVRLSTVSDFSVVISTQLTTNTSYYWTSGVNQNTRYFIDASGINGDNQPGNPYVVGSTYTHISAPTDLNFVLYQTSVSVSCAGVNFGVWSDSTAVRFSEVVKSTDSGWLKQENWILSNLSPNSTYFITAETRNGSGIVGGALSRRATTYIERVEGIEFIVYETSAQARVSPTSYTGIAEGQSGVKIWNITKGTETVWSKSPAQWWVLDENIIGLERNQQLVFYADSRNRDGISAGQTPNISTFTLCETPDISAEAVSSDTIKIYISRKENSSTNSQYAVEITSAPGYTFVRYVSTSGAVQDASAWGTYTQFGGAAGRNIVGLQPNLEYRLRVKARNGAQIETSYSLAKTTATRIEPPTGINLEVVGSTYMAISPAGSYSRLADGAAGIQIYSVSPSTDGGWRKNQSAWNFTGTSALTPNTEYTVKARARNIYGDINPVEIEITTRTRSAVPGPNASVINSSSAITARWTANGNPFGVNYSAECSSVSVGGMIFSSSGWTTDTEYAFAGLAPNARYHFRVRSRNDDLTMSDWRVLDSSYTKIEQPSAVSYIYTGQSSVTVSAAGALSSLAAGQSGISFEIAQMGDWEQIKSSSNWITQNGFSSAANLAANTTYWARLKVRNGDGIENGWVTSAIATRIENIAQLQFIVDAANNVKVAPLPPDYTSLADGLSGLQIYETTLSTSSGWRQTTDYWTLSGLSPNQQYTFNAKIRNRAGLENALTLSQATWTLSNIAAAPTLTAISTGILNVIINENSNPSHTQFSVEYSSRSDWTPSYYIDASGQASGTAAWLTKEEWGGVSPGRDLFALAPNRQYRARVYSRNVADISRSASPISLKYTLIESPTSFVWTSVGLTSVQLKASPEPSNLTYGGILFEVDGSNPQSSGWQSGTSANNWTFNNLSTNTLLDFSITTKNGDNIPNGAVSFAKATRIEPPASLTTEEIAATSLRLKVKSSNADESFTNLASGQSGIYFYGLNVSTDSAWIKQTTWTLTGLSPSTKYIFNVKSRNHDATIESGPLADGVTFYTAPVPASITHLSTGTPADTAILIKISSGTNGIETEYQVAVSTVNNFAAGTTYYVDANTGNLGVTPETAWGTHYLWTQDSGGKNIVGLSGNTMYYFKARAKNPQNVISAWSGVNQQSTNSSAPENLAVASLSSTTLRVSWTGVGPKYQVERATWNAPSGAPAGTNGWTRVMDWNAATTFDDASLTPNVRRWYRTRAGDTGDIGVSNWTSSLNNYTRAATPLAAAFSDVSSSEIRANWTSGGNPALTEYKVFVSSLGVGVSTITSYGYTTDLASQLFQFLDLNTTYYFWARARNGGGAESADGGIGSTSTLCATPAAPTLQATSTHTISITINEAGNPAAAKYSVRISSPNGQQKFIQATGQLGDSPVWRTKAEWEISGSTAAGLMTNTSYFVQAAAQNNNGVATTFSAGAAKFTYAAVPSTGAFAVWTTSVTVNFAGGGNPSNTFYQVRRSTHSQLTGSVENTDGNDISSGTFSSLELNSRHWFWVRAKNGDNIWSDHASFGARYTRIETASNMSFAVHWTSLTVTATDSFTSLGAGESRIILREKRTVQSSTHTSSGNLTWTCDGTLTPNTTYGFSVQSFNGDGLANAESAIAVKATRIENPTGMEFLETSTWYVKVAPKNDFSSLNVGLSGVEIQRVGSADSSGYQNSTSAWTNSGLDASRIYYYRARSKNRDDLANDWAMIFSTYTRANPPAPGSPSIPGRGVNFIEINWYENNNSTYTYYYVEGSSVSYGGEPTNASGWLPNTTYYLLNLVPNTSYYLRVKARNASNIETAWTQLGSAWTKIEFVTNISFDGVFRTSATLSALGGPFTRAGAGSSGVSIGVYRDEYYTDLRSSKPYDASAAHTPVNLVANTTYYFTANSRSGDGTLNDEVGTLGSPISRITLIERPAGVKFGVITNTSIQAAPDGNFTNLASTGSGVVTYCVAPSTESGWRNTTSYFTVSGLSPNTVYNFKADSRNRAGVTSGQTINISTYTLASSPLASVFTGITTSTIRASWTAGLPANPENTEYYVEASSVSQAGPYNYHDGWQTSIYRDFDNLSPNIKYYFRVKSRNFAAAESEWVDLGMKYTLIEQVTSADYNVYPSSISITASPQPSNLDEGSSGIIFTNLTTGVNSTWITNISYVFGSLTQNTTYQFRVNTKNGDGVSNTAYNLPLSCTLINPATGVAFGNFSATSVDVRGAGNFPSNLGAGLSAVAAEIRNADLDYSSHVWMPSQNMHTFVALSTNTAYTFRANSRNQFGASPSSTSWVTRYTLAATPGLVSVSTTTLSSQLVINSLNANTNPNGPIEYTDFAIAVATSSIWPTTYYVDAGGALVPEPDWISSGWGGKNVNGLAPNTTYYFKAVARNGDGIVTAFGPSSFKATRAATPQIVSVEPHSSGPSSKLLVNYSGAAHQYKLWFATYSATEANRALLSDWAASTSTLHEGLSPNRKYFYWVKSRNVELVESDFSDEASGWTQASQPASANPFYSAVSQDSMQVNWTAGTPANPSGTFYKIQRATSSDFGGTISELSGQNTYYYYNGTLAPNRRYFFRVAARNNADIPVWTQFSDLNLPSAGSATLIESPTGITVPPENVTTTALRAIADGEFFNLTNPDGGNSSAINLMYSSNAVTGASRGYGQQSYWDISGLTPNTTYTFSAISKNWDNIANTWIPYTSTTSTRIESPTGAAFIVSSMTIQSRPVFASGPTNLTLGSSGIKHVRGTVSLPDDDFEYVNSTSTWRTWSGLNPNTLHTFQIRTRNRQGLLNDWVTGFSTYTHCVIPSTPTVQDNPEDHTPPSGTHFTRVIVEGDNPVGSGKTDFAVWSINDGQWLNGLGGIQASVQWSTSTVWYHYNLNANTLYRYRVKARNLAAIETVLSSTGSVTTGPGAVDWITASERSVVAEGELYRIKWDWADVGGANYYELWISTDGAYYEQIAGITTELTTSYYTGHYPDLSNKKFWAKARGKQAGLSGYGGWSPSTWTYTQIERAQLVELNVTASTQIAMRARSIVNDLPAGFSRIQEGSSGISYWCSTSPSVGPTIFVSSVNWTKTTSYFQLPGSLMPNTTYYFKAQSRNALAEVMAIASVADSTVTWANSPAAPTLVVATSDTLRIAIATNGNPAHTLYAIYFDVPVERYVDASGNAVSATPVWRTYADWNGSAGVIVNGLAKSAEYKIKSRAQNSLGILTAWSPTLTAYTLGGQPIIENTSPGSTSPVWTNASTWKFRASNSDSYRWLWNKISDSVVSASSSDPWDGISEITGSIDSEGSWYFHVAGFSGDPASKTGQTTFGPIRYDNTAPSMGAVSCQMSASDATPIETNAWTREETPYFYWTEPYSSGANESPIVGYSITFSTNAEAAPDTSTDTADTFYDVSAPIAAGGVWYFRMRAKDTAGNWSSVISFTYKFNSGEDRPSVTAITPLGQFINGAWHGVSVSSHITVAFDRAMDKESTEASVALYAVRDKNGNTIFANISGATVYNTQNYNAVFTPGAPLLKNYTYRIVVTVAAKDSMGNNLAEAAAAVFNTMLDENISNTIVASDEKTKVEMESGAATEPVYVVINIDPQTMPIHVIPSDITEASAKVASSDARGFTRIISGSAREFTAYTAAGNRVSEFNAPVTLTIPYDDADRDGVVDGTSPGILAKMLKIVYLNEVTKEWEELESEVDTARRIVTARTTHFSVYALKGSPSTDVSAAYAYPVPFDTAEGHTKINFGKVPAAPIPSVCRIRIYTITGSLVKEQEINDGAGVWSWDVKTVGSQPVAPGVYIYVIENDDSVKKIGKLMVIR